jgi:hypothetical protein
MSKKTNKVLGSSFVENHKDIAEDEAMEKITQCELTIRDLTDEKKNDDKLNAAKQIVKDLNNGYNSAINYEKAKIQFLLEQIEKIRADEVNPTSGLTE